MTDRELMQEALYALTYVGDAKEIYSDTIESLRARLAQPEQEYVSTPQLQSFTGENPFSPQQKIKIHDCPRCHCHFMDSGKILSQTHDGKSWRDSPQFPAKVAAQPEQEPVAWKDAPLKIYLQVCDESDCDHPFDSHIEVSWCQDKINDSDIPYFRADTAPPQREWQGLTDEERTFLAWESNNGSECVAMTEAKLKEKNIG